MGIISIVLIPLFRSFIFTLIKNLKYDEIKVTCFNPFIQVFYFYKLMRLLIKMLIGM